MNHRDAFHKMTEESKRLHIQKVLAVRSWWCQRCSQEIYSLRCKYCGKAEDEDR
jgi:hypothetical protein